MTGQNHERTADSVELKPTTERRFTTAELTYRIATMTAVIFLLATFV